MLRKLDKKFIIEKNTMEKITSKITQKVKGIILSLAIGSLLLAIIFLLITASQCDALERRHHYGRHFSFFEFPEMYISLVFTLISVAFFIDYWMTSKMEITVTDKYVTGKTYFGRSVDLPMDSISSVGTSWFNGISVATDSGLIKFLYIENSKEIRNVLCNLLIERQKEKEKGQAAPTPMHTAASPADELKKYKELLDSGIITQEEFETKKRQLLGF